MESKIRILVGNLERNPFIKLAHVNPESFGPLTERLVLISLHILLTVSVFLDFVCNIVFITFNKYALLSEEEFMK